MWYIEAQAPQVKEDPDVLDKEKCLDALAELRHAKWFQVCTCALDSFSLTSCYAISHEFLYNSSISLRQYLIRLRWIISCRKRTDVIYVLKETFP